MAAIINSRELALQNTVPRLLVSEVNLTTTSSRFTKAKNNGAVSPSSITLTATLLTAGVYSASAIYTWEYSLSSAPLSWIAISASTSPTLAVTNSTYSGYIGTNVYVRYRCTVTESLRLTTYAYYDIYYLKEADDSLDVQITNGTVIVPASSAGVVTVFSNTGNTIKVLRGTSYLTYGASGANTFSISSVSVVPSGAVTVPAGSSATDTYTVGNISAMSSSESLANVTYQVDIRDASGNTTSYSIVQKFSKVNQLSSGEMSSITLSASLLSDISNDSKLTASEKQAIRREWDALVKEIVGLYPTSTTLGLTTELTTYVAELESLAGYMNDGSDAAMIYPFSTVPSWINDANINTTTDIVGSTFRTNWANAYADRQILLDKVTITTSLGVGDAVTLGLNGSFENWPSTLPTGWDYWQGAAPIKETTITRNGKYSIKYNAVGTDLGLLKETIDLSTNPLPLGSYLSGTVDIYLATVTSGLPGILIRLYTSSGLASPNLVDIKIQPLSSTTGVWQRIPWVAKVGKDQRIYGIRIYAMASWTSFPATFTGTVCFDNIDFYIEQSDAESNPAVAELDKYSWVLPADSTGVVAAGAGFTGANATINMYRKGLDDSSNWTYSRTASDGSITTTLTTRTVAVTAISSSLDTGYVDITATPNAALLALGYVALTQRFTLSKNKSAALVFDGPVPTIGVLYSVVSNSDATTYAGIRFNSNGSISKRTAVSSYSDSGKDWYLANITDIGTAYKIRVILTSGTLTGDSASAGVWHLISTVPVFAASRASNGESILTADFAIATAADTSVVVATGSLNIIAEKYASGGGGVYEP